MHDDDDAPPIPQICGSAPGYGAPDEDEQLKPYEDDKSRNLQQTARLIDVDT